MVDDKLVAEFDEAMLSIYERARSEAHYNATRFLHMLHEHRGRETARLLLHSPTVSEGYTALRGRLDLTVEAIIHDNPRWQVLFTDEELHICNERLKAYQYLHAHTRAAVRQSAGMLPARNSDGDGCCGATLSRWRQDAIGNRALLAKGPL